jgi:hypothetical protein
MSQSTWVKERINNRNFLAPNGFKLSLINFPQVSFYCQSANIPGISIPEIDIVCICTPNGLHAEHSLLALEYRKHVVCEKPLAITKADCEKIIYKALQVSRNVFGVMQNRYSPPSAWLKEVIEKKLLGDIYLVQLNCYWNRDDRYYKNDSWHGKNDLDGGTLFTQFSHFIDIMYYFKLFFLQTHVTPTLNRESVLHQIQF